MKDEKEAKVQESKYEPPKILEKKELKIELFSDEPDPWGPCGP